MSQSPRRLLLQITFALRLLLFLAAPTLLVYGIAPSVVAMIVIAGILATWMADLLADGTIWIAAHRGTITAQVLFLIVACGLMVKQGEFAISSVLTMLTLLLALSSDAITNSQRWKLLLPAGVVAAAIVNLIPQSDAVDWGAGAYPIIPFLGALARLVFPRTKNLIHTSLDYPPIRVEILSLGMKRVASVGIRRNSTPLP